MTAKEIPFDEYTRRIDPRAILDYYDAENAFEQTNTDGTVEVIHSCLLDRVESHHQNGDQHPSAALNIDRKLYVCYSYSDPDPDSRYWGKSGMNLFRLIMKLEGKSDVSQVIPEISRFLDGTVKEKDDFAAELEALCSTVGRDRPAPIRTYSARILEPWAYVHPYIVERGIDIDTASRLHIGFDSVENRITIPHFWRGQLVGWQKRAIPERAGEWPGTANPEPKYRSSPGFPKSTTLYRYDDALQSRRVCVVESPFSVIRSQARRDGIAVVATFGAKITDQQIQLLRRFDEVVVWMDADGAGAGAERRLVEQLYRTINVSVVKPDYGMDLGDYEDPEEVRVKIDDAIPAWMKLTQIDKEKKKWVRSNLASAR